MLGNLLSPIIGLSMVRASLQKELKIKVPEYSIEYKAIQREIFFHIPQPDKSIRKYPYEQSAKLATMIEGLVKNKLKTKDVINMVFINHVNDTAKVEVYYTTETGEKNKLTKHL